MLGTQSHPETKGPTAHASPVVQHTERDDLNYSLIQSLAFPGQAPILDVKAPAGPWTNILHEVQEEQTVTD